VNKLQQHLTSNYQEYYFRVLKQAKCVQTAEDTLSTLFIKLHNATSEPININAFMNASATFTFKTLWVRQKKHDNMFPSIELEFKRVSSMQAADLRFDDIDTPMLVEMLKTHINALPRKRKEVLTHMLHNDMNLADSARFLGMDLESFKTNYRLGIKDLQNSFKKAKVL
jgi:DNA-directed RNA polymerase specialized sigma24 family protein